MNNASMITDDTFFSIDNNDILQNNNPSRAEILRVFYYYFNNPNMTKTRNVDKFSVYISKIHSRLGNGYRYLLLFTPKDNNEINSTMEMKDLNWSVLQTRLLEENHGENVHG